jgi:PAS domain S-box-containing protein
MARFHYVNNALCRMAGLPREELLESRIEDVSRHRADVDREEHWRELEAEGHLKYSVHREDQGTVLLAVIVDRVDYGGGQYEVGFVEDVTERERAVQALQRNEAQLRAILESSTDAMAGIDETGSIVLFNRAAETLFGWGVDEITGRAVELLMPESCRQQHRADRESYFRTGEPNAAIGTTKVLPAITRDGRYLAVELSLSRVPGDPPIVLATMRDHTERQRLEHDLHTQNLLLEEIINAIPAPVFYKDLDGKYVDCNEQFADLVGRPRADVAGLGVDDVAPRELAELYARMDEELLRSGRAQIYEAAARYPDGTERNVMFHKAVYHDFAGRPAGIVGVMLDVTERKRAEEDRQLLAGAVEHAQDGIAIADRGGLTRYVNPAFARLIGVPVDQVRGMDPAATLARGEDRLASCMWRALRSKGTWSGVIAALPGEDGRPEMEATASAVLDSSGGPTAFIFVLRDLTERARLDHQLRQSQKLESIGQLAAGIAHEINTPIQYVGDNVRFFQDAWADLSPVLRSARDLGDSRDAAKGVAALAEQISAADPEYLLEEVPLAIDQSLEGISRISAIVRAMKEFSHPGGEAKSLADLNKAIEITVTVSRNEWKYVADLELNLDPALPPVPCLLGDINQVLLNLVTNSAHAIKEARGEESEPRGTITISSSCDDMFAYIKVSDTGCGIPEEIRHRVFDPFFTTKDVGKGTGQGLSLAHAVVHERHQGRLELESEVGVGTTFTIALPLHAEPEAGGP